MNHDRVFCFGDSITLAANDSRGMGWPGRLGRGLRRGDKCVAMYNLGVNGDTSLDIAARWRAEANARSRNARGLLLVAFGFNDASRPSSGELQVQLDESLSCAGTMLQEAAAFGEVLWIGPTPLDESVNPLQTEFDTWTTYNAEIKLYDQAYAGLAAEIGIDYLSLFAEFVDSPRYLAALRAADGVHPADDGYAMIAESIAAWECWQRRR